MALCKPVNDPMKVVDDPDNTCIGSILATEEIGFPQSKIEYVRTLFDGSLAQRCQQFSYKGGPPPIDLHTFRPLQVV